MDILKWLSDNKDLVQAICSLFAILISFLSILLVFFTLRSNRKHNRLSVKPILRVDRTISTGKDVTVSLKNSGIGPATIESINIKVDGVPLPDYNDKSWDIALNKVISHKYDVRIFSPFIGESFSAGESHHLYEVSFSSLTEEDYPILLEAFQKITFEISYSSMYHEIFKKEL